MCRRTAKTPAMALEKRGRVRQSDHVLRIGMMSPMVVSGGRMAVVFATRACLHLLGLRSFVDPSLLQIFLLKCLKTCRHRKQLGPESQACEIKTMVRYKNNRNKLHLPILKTFRRQRKEKQRTTMIENNKIYKNSKISSANTGIKFQNKLGKKRMSVGTARRRPTWRWTRR